MRYRELLLEYSHEVTLRNYGKALWNHFWVDESYNARNLRLDILHQAKGMFQTSISNEEAIKWQKFVESEILKSIEHYDPTTNHKYVLWLVSAYIRGGISRWEDLSKARETLKRYDEIKQNGYFKRHPESVAEFGDIGRIKNLSTLTDFVNSLAPEETVSNNQKEKELEETLVASGQAIIVYNGPQFKVVIPKTKEASCVFGRNTQWCTAATQSDNMFSSYANDGPLYIILHKPTNRRWQFHFETGQFMDEHDNDIKWEDFPKEFFTLNVFDYSRMSEETRIISCAYRNYYAPEIRKIWSDMTYRELTFMWALPGYSNEAVGNLKEFTPSDLDVFSIGKSITYTEYGNTSEPLGQMAIAYANSRYMREHAFYSLLRNIFPMSPVYLSDLKRDFNKLWQHVMWAAKFDIPEPIWVAQGPRGICWLLQGEKNWVMYPSSIKNAMDDPDIDYALGKVYTVIFNRTRLDRYTEDSFQKRA